MCLLAVLALLSMRVAHARPELRVLAIGDTPAVREILAALQNRYPALTQSGDPKVLARRAGPAIYLAIGPAALQAGLEAELQPLVSLFTSSQTYQQVVAASTRPTRHQGVTAIYPEVSPQIQLEVIAALYRRPVSVGVLLSELTEPLAQGLQRAAGALGLDLLVRRAASRANVVRELGELGGAKVILAIPDGSLYTKENLALVLESTYRRGQPVVGFSAALVHAGTLASAYASVEDVVAHFDQLEPQLGAGPLPPPQYPLYWRVLINDHVAKSLGVVVPEGVRDMGRRPQARPQ
ncbi:hypothetical protein [Caldimonas brevitalea]|uniref:ABC transporter substrate-binding protein n=1 Tax=Caldimonas brevitalea TaxID=413882 RepID=A0A0G3BKP6_9BURK|nr:hypothetical protein [Caldimonas brevitalea]AKJ27115.1 hypothetical protein AAW51_0424 [Caldimonas brevitalea]